MDDKTPQKAPEDLSSALADKLRNLRYARGLSQESLAHRAGISTYTYQKFEKGESKPGTPMNPRLFTLVALANALDVELTDLLTFEKE